MRMRVLRMWAWWTVCGLFAVGCSDDSTGSDDLGENTAGGHAHGGHMASQAGGPATMTPTTADLDAFAATGLNKYVGAAKPARTEMVGNEVHHYFDESDGPVCLRGAPFAMATRDMGSEDLVIYLQGGGSCRTDLCRATEMANPQIPTYGVLNANDSANPVAGWNVAFSPYCDGSLHFGDSDIPDMNRKHHGLRNISAALDVAVAAFPNPQRILLTGASAGGYGTIWITALVRLLYPEAKLFVFNDAGIAIANPENPEGFRSTLDQWGARQFIPQTCAECLTSPHLTAWMGWNLQRDPGLTLAMFSSYEDSVIAQTFLMLDPAVFKQALLEETAKVVETAPTRAKRFLINGTQHTAGNIHTTAVGSVSIAQWLGAMLNGDPAWDNVLQ